MTYQRGSHDWSVGDICTHEPSGNWYVVRRIGNGGGCYGPCFYGPDARGVTVTGLRARTTRIELNRVPDQVVKALAYWSLTGKVLPYE